MKKSLIGFVIFLLLAVSVSAAVNDPKLSFWTPLDEHDGLLTPELAHGLWVRLPQPPAFNVVPGVINNSFNFSGASNAYLLSLNSGDLDCTNALTLNLWAYFNNTGVHTISRRNPEALKKGYTIYFNSDKKVEFQIGNFTHVFKVVSPNALELDKWYHIVGTHNSTAGMKLYINGTLVNSTAVLQNIYPDYGVGLRLCISASGDTRFRVTMVDAA
ncbi:LamG domain-containing protein, partial [Candidatus Woesearchaeota archaeon]|nr:LamG domain-containing protein [Candidatus Woesearchaeota archaeon]